MRRMTRVAALAAIVAVVLGGCTLTGGGWMPGASGGKATFGFDITCQEGFLVGSWVYHDKKANPKVNAHGTLTSTSGGFDPATGNEVGIPCSNDAATENEVILPLVYTARPCNDGCDEGRVLVSAVDTGSTGPNKGDSLTVLVIDGPYGGYSNEQVLGGGNLTVAGLPL